MAIGATSRLVVAAVLAVASADCGRTPGPRDAGAAPDLRRYAPSTLGDRYRFEDVPGGLSHVGVTARTASGLAAMHGTHRSAVTFVETASEGVFVASPEGARLFPLLRAPLEQGREAPFTLPDGNACTLRVMAVGTTATVANTPFASCVDVARRCDRRLAVPQPTVTVETERYCPGIGLVYRRFSADPPLPLEGLPASVESRVVAFHVAGAPPMRDADATTKAIVLPSDVSAACGGTVLRSTLAAPTPSDFEQSFELADGAVVVAVSRAGDVRVTVPESCAEGGAARLEGMVRALLAR